MARPFTLAAVAYDSKVVTIWEGFKDFFTSRGLAFDYVLYSNYESQVAAHFAGHADAAWNSPLAWLESQRIAERKKLSVEAVAMRNSDCDLKSFIVTRTNAGVGSLADLHGKKIAVGAKDSPQATLIPLEHLAGSGLLPEKDFHIEYFDVLCGKHGDHIGGERDAVRALMAGRADAACMIDGNYTLFCNEGTLNAGAVQVLATTPAYDHCNFTVIAEHRHADTDRFVELLLAMDYGDAAVRPLLDMEGLKKWLRGRTSGYALLDAAIRRFGTVDAFVRETAA